MSRQTISWACRKHETASSYCSRYRELTMASRKLREPSTAVYQFGRGSEPMIEVGRAIPADALYIVSSLVLRPSLPSYGSGEGKAGIILGCAAQKSTPHSSVRRPLAAS